MDSEDLEVDNLPLRKDTELSTHDIRNVVKVLNEEFAVPLNAKMTWEAELEGGGVCEAFCLAMEEDGLDPMSGCNGVTACLCGRMLGAERVGNMPVLWARRRPGKPTQLLCMVGPFWPCLVTVTYPLILGVSLFCAVFLLPGCPWWAQVTWSVCTLTLVVSLGLTGCTNPGLVRRHADEPPPNSVGWRWSDQAQTYRPPRSTFDRDCGVVIEEFDHTCPWTGTGIGRLNMPYFTTFVSCVCICLIFDIMLLVGVFDPTRPMDAEAQ